MSRHGKLIELAEKSLELIKEVIVNEEDCKIISLTLDEGGDSIIFTLKYGKTVEYSISEIGYIFEDDIDGLEIFSVKKYKDIYIKLKRIQYETEIL